MYVGCVYPIFSPFFMGKPLSLPSSKWTTLIFLLKPEPNPKMFKLRQVDWNENHSFQTTASKMNLNQISILQGLYS